MTQAVNIKVVVHGASGKMGREVLVALCLAQDMEPAGAVSRSAAEGSLPLPDGSGLIPLSRDLTGMLVRVHPQVVVDFSSAEGALTAARACAERGAHLVTGSTGLGERALGEMETLAHERHIGILVAPNFALGAVLLLHLVSLAGRYFQYAEIMEAHHEAKADAPSGTALALARAIAAAGRGQTFRRPMPSREPLAGTRGGEHQGISIHSARMPGRLAHHEVTFGAPGQTLSLRHDTINRECYMPGVLLGIRHVLEHPGLTVGLEKVLGL